MNANPPSISLEANTFGMRTAVGKEWWISAHWGIGAAVEFIFTLTGHSPTANGNAFAGALTLSTTYN